jgi:hypothetical protein
MCKTATAYSARKTAAVRGRSRSLPRAFLHRLSVVETTDIWKLLLLSLLLLLLLLLKLLLLLFGTSSAVSGFSTRLQMEIHFPASDFHIAVRARDRNACHLLATLWLMNFN